MRGLTPPHRPVRLTSVGAIDWSHRSPGSRPAVRINPCQAPGTESSRSNSCEPTRVSMGARHARPVGRGPWWHARCRWSTGWAMLSRGGSPRADAQRGVAADPLVRATEPGRQATRGFWRDAPSEPVLALEMFRRRCSPSDRREQPSSHRCRADCVRDDQGPESQSGRPWDPLFSDILARCRAHARRIRQER